MDRRNETPVVNPYAPPAEPDECDEKSGVLWKSSFRLAIRNPPGDLIFPDVCLLTGEPATERYRIRADIPPDWYVSLHNQWVAALQILVGVMAIFRDTLPAWLIPCFTGIVLTAVPASSFRWRYWTVALSAAAAGKLHATRRKRHVFLTVYCIGLIGMSFPAAFGQGGYNLPACAALLLLALPFPLILGKGEFLRKTSHTKDWIFLDGAHKDFLAPLPYWLTRSGPAAVPVDKDAVP